MSQTVTHAHHPKCDHLYALAGWPGPCCPGAVDALALPREDPRARFCVCARLFTCTEHGTAHVGTHD